MKYSFPNILIRMEGLVVLVSSLFLYAHFGGKWWLFAVLFLFPDLGLLVYLINHKVGIVLYNLLHVYAFPVACIACHLITGQTNGALFTLGFMWTAHIGMDRVLGYGFKYINAPFFESHIQKI